MRVRSVVKSVQSKVKFTCSPMTFKLAFSLGKHVYILHGQVFVMIYTTAASLTKTSPETGAMKV